MRKIILLFNILFLIGLSGCVDRDFRYDDEELGDGFADLRLTASFENLAPALESRAPGNAIHDIDRNQLWVVLYRQLPDGTFEYYDHKRCADLPGFSFNQSGNTAEPTYPSNEPQGNYQPSVEGATARAGFNMTDIPYGRYRMYAVANVASLTREQCATEETLKLMTFEWNEDDISKNNAMFGYFTPASDQSASGFQSTNPIVISRRSVDLHCWVKRLASKVTVAFDPSQLDENITIYVKSVTIRDIPKTCKLGENNIPGSDDLIKIGESINYYTAETEDDYTKWGIRLQRGSGKKGSVNHTNSDPALYFYENMQGDYEGQEQYLKTQIADETGKPVEAPGDNLYGPGTNDFKDRVPNGTWIEVEAFYHSPLSSGHIIYRFMMGKNTTYNYDAERNYHYKLTLKFRGKANETDWHIKYTEEPPALFTPDSYNVSYLYGQQHGFPLRVYTGEENVENYVVKAEIIVNGWYPTTEGTDVLPAQTIGAYNNLNGFAWNAVANGKSGPYYEQNYAGFLSMRQPEASLGSINDLRYGTAADAQLKSYYDSHRIAHGAYTLETGERIVGNWNDATNTYVENSNSADGKYKVTHSADGSATVMLPMYTRQKDLITTTDFSGSNPFWAYVRTAKIRFTLWTKAGVQVPFTNIKDPSQKTWQREIPIYQVRRVENPTAIYRKSGSTEPFDVTLMTLSSANATSYTPIYSNLGPWRASILVDPRGLVKLSKNGKVVTKPGDYVMGSTGSEISFRYEPTSTIAEGDTRCAIILVEYDDFNCNHYILVRQGYDKGVELAGTNWSCYQVYATGQYTAAVSSGSVNPQEYTSVNVMVTRSPLSIGTYYKRNQYNFGILESNNDTYGWLKSIESTTKNVWTSYLSGSTVAKQYVAWNTIGAYGWLSYAAGNTDHPDTGPTSVPNVTINDKDKRFDKKWADTWTTVGYQPNQKLTVPTYEQFIALKACDFSYGIAYADGATSPAIARDDAYGFTDYENTGDGSTKGMRVCIAYSKANGNNVLFPLGATGQGRRSRQTTRVGTPVSGQTAQSTFSVSGGGSLTYSGITTLLYGEGNLHRPLTYNIYRSPGAIYWIKQPKLTTQGWPEYASWDINYYTTIFNRFDYASLGNWSQTDATTGKGLPQYSSSAIKNSAGQITGYKYTWAGATPSNCSDALPIKLIYK